MNILTRCSLPVRNAIYFCRIKINLQQTLRVFKLPKFIDTSRKIDWKPNWKYIDLMRWYAAHVDGVCHSSKLKCYMGSIWLFNNSLHPNARPMSEISTENALETYPNTHARAHVHTWNKYTHESIALMDTRTIYILVYQNFFVGFIFVLPENEINYLFARIFRLHFNMYKPAALNSHLNFIFWNKMETTNFKYNFFFKKSIRVRERVRATPQKHK